MHRVLPPSFFYHTGGRLSTPLVILGRSYRELSGTVDVGLSFPPYPTPFSPLVGPLEHPFPASLDLRPSVSLRSDLFPFWTELFRPSVLGVATSRSSGTSTMWKSEGRFW